MPHCHRQCKDGDLSSAIRFREVDASGVFDLSRAIPVGSIVRAQGPPARRDITLFLSSSFLDIRSDHRVRID
jgi:hypothetical protein